MHKDNNTRVESIYIVDDDKIVLLDLAKKISDFGYQTFSFDNGKDFLEDFQFENELCVVFLDINMPEIHGLSLLEDLKKRQNCIPVIISSLNDINTYKKALKYGAYDYLVKPIKRIELFETIEKVKYRYRQSQQKMTNRELKSSLLKKLTKREYEVLDLLLLAKPTDEVAKNLSISKNTVDVHRRNILLKLDCKSLIEVSFIFNQS